MEALDVGGGELLRGIGRGSADAHLEGTESVEDHALAVGEGIGDFCFQCVDHGDDVWLGEGASLTDFLGDFLGADHAVYYGLAVDFAAGS